jgi:hypothetical protein
VSLSIACSSLHHWFQLAYVFLTALKSVSDQLFRTLFRSGFLNMDLIFTKCLCQIWCTNLNWVFGSQFLPI